MSQNWKLRISINLIKSESCQWNLYNIIEDEMFKHQNLISNILIQDQEKLKLDIDFF